MTTDITKLAQREKFEAWFVNDVVGADVTFPAFEDGAYAEGEIYDEQFYFMLQAMWMAWKAAGAELVEALEKAQLSIAELEREQEHLRPVGVMSEKAFHRLENSECRFIALWPRPGIFLPRKRPEDGVIVYARTAAPQEVKP